MEHDLTRAVNYLQELRAELHFAAPVIAKHRSAISSMWGPLPEYNHLWFGKIPVVMKYMNAIRSQDAADLLTADQDDGAGADTSIPVVLEDDIISAMIRGPSDNDLSLKMLSGKFCTLLILGSKRRPSCLTRTIRDGIRWTDSDLCATVVLPKEARQSITKTRSLSCERLSLDPKADVVSVYKSYIARSFPSGTLLVSCRKQKGLPVSPSPNTIRFWMRDYLISLGYPSYMMITPYILIKSVTTAQLSAGREIERVSRDRWDSPSTMLKHYDLRGKVTRVLRPQALVLNTSSTSRVSLRSDSTATG